jgi:chromosome segregation ATPase
MKQMMIGFTTLIFCIAFIVPAATAQEKSDYDVIQGFKKSLNEIQIQIEKASTVQECVDITSRIDDLEKEYAGNVALLDKALYPDGYNGKISFLRTQLKLAQEKLGIIETQYARITDLEAQVKSLTGKVDSLTGENANLLAQVQKMDQQVQGAAAGMASNKGIIDSLNKVIRTLRGNIKERDSMIFALVDSLFMQYDKSVSSMKDVEKQSLAGRLERRSVFGNVRKSIEDNIAFLQTTTLSSKDLVEMINEQKRFASQWKAFGAKLQGLYEPGKKGANQMKDIQSRIDEWGQKADATFWRGLNLAFQERGLAVKPFNSGGEFKTNLIDFMSQEIKDAEEGKKEESFKQ